MLHAKKEDPEKQSGVIPVKSSIQIDLRLIAKIILTKELFVRYIKKEQMISEAGDALSPTECIIQY